MDERPLTPREAYERMMNGEMETGQRGSALFARHLLRSQAGKLAAEKCTESMAFTPDGTNPWTASITFTCGELSDSAQKILGAMHSNAHRTEMTEGADRIRISFYVYEWEEE